jgi:PPE family
MKVDAPGLVAAAQRLISAVETLGGAGVPHPPLAADPASIGAAARLTTAGEGLTAALGAHVSTLVASVEHLTGAAISFLDTDERNAAAIATLNGAAAGAGSATGSAPPAPPIPPDVRAPLPPPVNGLPEAISAAAHSGSPDAGELFTSAWHQVGSTARDAAGTIRSAVAHLPETLDGPASTPAVSRHLLSFADGLDTYADRAHNLVYQANAYAGNQFQARQDIPTPPQFADAQRKIQTLANANAASGGKYAVPLANAVADKNQLNQKAVAGYTGYHEKTDADTAGDDPGTDSGGSDPTALDGATPDGGPDPNGGPVSPENAGEMAAMLPQMIPAVLGAAGGLVGGLLGSVTKVPEALMQAGTQAVSAATQGLSGLADPKSDPLDGGRGAPAGDSGDGGGAGDAPTTPAGGGGPDPSSLSVAPTTGAPPTPAIAPAGAVGGPTPPASPGGAGFAPMGMPMGGLGGLGGAPGGGNGGGKGETDRRRKVAVRDVPHTEDVTGRVDLDRLSAAASGGHDPEPPDDSSGPDPAAPVVRRLVTKPPKEPS